MVDAVVAFVLSCVAQKAFDEGCDFFFNKFNKREVPGQAPPASAVEARRHDFSTGAAASSDVDITVRHRPALRGDQPVILTFQRFDILSEGWTVPMVLREPARLRVDRDQYVFAALIVDPPKTRGSKMTLRAVGWTRQWVASNELQTFRIETQQPTPKQMKKLGLVQPDGASPFVLAAPAPARTPNAPASVAKLNPADRPTSIVSDRSATSVSSSGSGTGTQFFTRTCRARVPFKPQCRAPVWKDEMCEEHWSKAKNGMPVFDAKTGAPLRPRPWWR